MNNHIQPFGDWAEIYRDVGLWPRPLIGKACKLPQWQTPDDEFSPQNLDEWVREYPSHNIGLLMGTPFPDGTRLGAIDVDHDKYAPLAKALLNNPPYGRIGKKGVLYFVRIEPDLKNKKLKVKGIYAEEYGQVVECLFLRSICVIPPSIHPDTNQPYRWIGEPLHETDFTKLPLIGE